VPSVAETAGVVPGPFYKVSGASGGSSQRQGQGMPLAFGYRDDCGLRRRAYTPASTVCAATKIKTKLL